MSTSSPFLLATPQELSPEKIILLQEEFAMCYGDAVKMEDIFIALDDFFGKNFSEDTVKKYYETYWYWYVCATWDRLLTLDKERVIFCLNAQFSSAFCFNQNVEENFLFFLYRRFSKEQEMAAYFRKVKEVIIHSPTLIGSKSKTMTLASVVTQYAKLKKAGDTLLIAGFMSEVERELVFPQSIEKAQQQELTKRLLNFLLFIYQEDDIVPLVNDYIIQSIKTRSHFFEKPEHVDADALTDKNVYPSIEQDLINKFTIGADGQFENIEGVMGYLDEIATAKQDEKIRDLYIFNENTGLFEWNTQLIDGNI